MSSTTLTTASVTRRGAFIAWVLRVRKGRFPSLHNFYNQGLKSRVLKDLPHVPLAHPLRIGYMYSPDMKKRNLSSPGRLSNDVRAAQTSSVLLLPGATRPAGYFLKVPRSTMPKPASSPKSSKPSSKPTVQTTAIQLRVPRSLLERLHTAVQLSPIGENISAIVRAAILAEVTRRENLVLPQNPGFVPPV